MKLRKTSPVRRYVITRSAHVDAKQRAAGAVTCHAERADGHLRRLVHVKFHSPAGFEVGSLGRGSADLALSITADLLQAPRAGSAYRRPSGRAAEAWVLHQHLKARFLATLKIPNGGEAELDGSELYAWALEQHERVHRARREEQSA